MTAEIIHLDMSNARTMNNIKGSIAWMVSKNTDGKYSDQIDRERDVLKHFFNVTLGRNPANDNSEAVNAA